jgi:eukaryotic-like serine/threonine-protein kinase
MNDDPQPAAPSAADDAPARPPSVSRSNAVPDTVVTDVPATLAAEAGSGPTTQAPTVPNPLNAAATTTATVLAATFNPRLPPGPAPRQLSRFSITRLLRREQNSVVYLGTDPVLHREVIIKAVQLPPLKDATPHLDAQMDPLEQAFVRQAQAAGKLAHPHIVTVYEAGRLGDTGYLAIERVNGRGLHELIASGWRPQFVHCASIAARIADAIEHAHQQGVAHGHLGPQHVVLQVDGVPKVEGFGGWIDGGAGGDDALARTEKLLPYFHSELTDEARRADVRAVTSLVYMMVTGKAPKERPAPVATLRADVPPTLARLIDDILAPSSTTRRTAGDLRDALTSFIWNERRDNVAPATIGIPLAAPPRRPEAAGGASRSDAYAPTVAIELDEPLLSAAKAPGTRPSSRPATLAIRPGTAPAPTVAETLPPLPPEPPLPAGERLHDAWHNAIPWLQRNRMLVGGVAGLAITATVIAAILAATAGPGVPLTPAAAPPAAPVAAPVPTGTGTVELDIAPWGEVFVDGKPIGVSPPLLQLTLPAGRHGVEIRYGDKAAVTAQVDVDPAKPLQIRHRFE